MDLLSIVVALAVVGFVVWLVVTYIPMPAPFPKIIIAFAALIVLLWLLRMVVGPLPLVR